MLDISCSSTSIGVDGRLEGMSKKVLMSSRGVDGRDSGLSKKLAESMEGLGRVSKEVSDRTLVFGQGFLLLRIGEEGEESGMANRERKSGEWVSSGGDSGMSNTSRKSSISRSIGESDMGGISVDMSEVRICMQAAVRVFRYETVNLAGRPGRHAVTLNLNHRISTRNQTLRLRLYLIDHYTC
jgi:hypothetical protein